ncbi:acyl-[acyl-carrier-protein] thioesterase [Clostridium ihumii]|uniref:acyl-[acyl-carrier-protein] thioesterase n=1 Tax=Clostridium ihumii TaxID=1470356 RepID=UPI003D32E02A
MSAIYSEKYKIKFYETDYSKKIMLHSIINYMQEVSSNHANLLGCGYDNLEEKGQFWVVSKINLEILKYPKWNDEIVFETWPQGLDKMFFIRGFRMCDLEGNTLCYIEAAYLLVDRKSMFPHKPTEADLEYETIKDRFKPYKRVGKFRLNDITGENIDERKIRYNDIDLNMHVNNSKYIEWIEDCFKLEIFNEKRIKNLQINFIKETKEGQKVVFYKYNDSENVFFIEGIEKDSETKLFQSKIVFE